MSDNLHWCSQQFSALGAGFLQDDTVEDGLHLRWVVNQRLGLPIENDTGSTGLFRIYHLAEDFPSLYQQPLSALGNNTGHTIYSTQNLGSGSGLDTAYGEGNRFYRKVNIGRKQLVSDLLTKLGHIDGNDPTLLGQQKELVHYLKEVLNGLMPEKTFGSWFDEIAEVCAADVQMTLNSSANGPHAWVRGFDRQHNMIAEDWVGNENGSAKNVARLMAPNIYYFNIEHQISSGLASQEDVWWLFCEDYCQAGFWTDSAERKFKLTDDTYNKTFVEHELYAPFKKQLNWGEAAVHLERELVENEFVQAMAAHPDTYNMLKQKANLFVGLPEDQPADEPEISMPVLSSLMQSSIDPLMAQILGLYYYAKPSEAANQSDYKVEAYLPFFNEDNLLKLGAEVMGIFAHQNIPFSFELEALTGLPAGTGGNFFRSTALCGLVLNPTITSKQKPVIPSTPQTVVQADDVPAQEGVDRDNGIMDIFVNSRLQIDKGTFLTQPYLNTVAYEVERNLSNSGFVNVIEQEDEQEDEPDILAGMGILPPIYLPKSEDEADIWELRDDFKLQITTDDTVQYQIRGFDIFGRPSSPEIGTIETIPVPCNPPLRPGQLLANITPDGNDLNLELHFSVTDVVPHLRATQKNLEIAIYRLDQGATGAAENVQWVGTKLSRTFNVDYHPNGDFLNTPTLALGCAELTWSGDEVEWSSTASGNCDVGFPFDLNSLSLTQFASPMNDEAETDQRLYRLYAKIGEESGLAFGQHRWCIRVRIAGRCDSGPTIYSGDVCVGAEHIVMPPPPAVLQPVQQRIPESTYADPAGDAFYYLDLQSFFPPNSQQEPLVNIYQAVLTGLTDNPETVVDGDLFASVGEDGIDGAARIQTIGKTNRPKFQRVSEVPVALTAETRYFPVPVRGDLEEYYVIGVIGCDSEFNEKDWRQAGIVLYKTPQPIPAPLMRFESASYNMAKSPVEVTLNFRAEFANPHDDASPLPKVQIMRHDMSTGNSRFVGETVGVELAAEGDPGHEVYPFEFRLVDANPLPYRRYRYEAILMQHAPKHGKTIKSGQTADCELLVPYRGHVSPFSDTYGLQEQTTGGTTASFSFNAGDFELSLTHVLAATGQSTRHTGTIYQGELQGLPNSKLELNKSTGSYTLTFEDNNIDPSIYTLRLWQGQQKVWSQKAVKNE